MSLILSFNFGLGLIRLKKDLFSCFFRFILKNRKRQNSKQNLIFLILEPEINDEDESSVERSVQEEGTDDDIICIGEFIKDRGKFFHKGNRILNK